MSVIYSQPLTYSTVQFLGSTIGAVLARSPRLTGRRFLTWNRVGLTIGIFTPSAGSRGDSYDNALAQSVIGLFKTEVTCRRGPWGTVKDVEFTTLAWMDWFSTQRLLEPIG